MKWNKTYPDRDAKKDYHLIPNELYYLGLNCKEFAVYCYLMFLEKRTTYESYAKMSTIGKVFDIKSRKTIAKTIQSLVEKHFITVENTLVQSKTGQIQNGCLRFHIRPIEEAIRYHHECEIERLEKERAEEKLKKAIEKVNAGHKPKVRNS